MDALVAQLDRASDFDSEGREFESLRARQARLRSSSPAITATGPDEYPCGNNLYLIVTPTGGRRWAFRYQRNGIVRKMGFGSAKAAGLNLSEAKDKAIDALRLLAKSCCPAGCHELLA